MIQGYENVSIIYGGSRRRYAEALNDKLTKIFREEHYPIQATIANGKNLFVSVHSLHYSCEYGLFIGR